MTCPSEKHPIQIRLAVGVVVDNDFDSLEKTVKNANLFSEKVYVLDLRDSETTRNALQSLVPKERCLAMPNTTDRAAARNRLIETIESSGDADWLIWMKAGESFDEATWDDFLEFVNDQTDDGNLYVMISRRLVRPNGARHDMDEENIEPRLMPLGKGLRYHGRVGESLYPIASSLMIPLSAAPGRFLCPSRYVDAARQRSRGAANLHLIGRIAEQGGRVRDESLALLAAAKIDLGDYRGARVDLVRLISETAKANLRLEAYYDLWETLLLAPEPQDETTRLMVGALDCFPVDMQLLTFMGNHLQRIGKIDLAIRTFETAVRHGRISLDVWHRRHIRETAVVSLALALRVQGNVREAMSVLEKNLEHVEDISEYGRYLLDIYIAEFEELKAHELAASLFGAERLDQLRDVLTGACHASAGDWETALGPLESAYQSGCRDVLGLRWYSLTLLSLLRFEEAIPVIVQWVEADPTGIESKTYLQAAVQPQNFSQIVGRMRSIQRKMLGLGEESQSPSITAAAVLEMVGASGKQADCEEVCTTT